MRLVIIGLFALPAAATVAYLHLFQSAPQAIWSCFSGISPPASPLDWQIPACSSSCRSLRCHLVLLTPLPLLILGLHIAFKHLLAGRPLFTFHLHLLHPRAPSPTSIAKPFHPRDLQLALRLAHPKIRSAFVKATGNKLCNRSVSFCTDAVGRAIPTEHEVFVEYCNRFLRYALRSRLCPEQTTPAAQNRNDSPLRSAHHPLSTATSATKTDFAASLRAQLSLTVHKNQLSSFSALTTATLIFGALFGLDGFISTIFTLLGIAWIVYALSLYQRQITHWSEWMRSFESNRVSAPLEELKPPFRTWQHVPYRDLNVRDDCRFSIPFNSSLNISVAVLLFAYLTLIQVLSHNF